MISSTRTFSDPENNKLGQLSEELVELLGGVRRADNPNEPVIKDHPKVVYTNNAICTWEVFIWLFNPLVFFFWRRFQDFGSLRVWVIGPLLVKAKPGDLPTAQHHFVWTGEDVQLLTRKNALWPSHWTLIVLSAPGNTKWKLPEKQIFFTRIHETIIFAELGRQKPIWVAQHIKMHLRLEWQH